MSSGYRTFDLGALGIHYVKGQLARGNTLSKLIAKTVNIDRGSASAHLPAEVEEERLPLFSDGGIAEPAESRASIAQIIKRDLHANEAYILENARNTRDDLKLAKFTSRTHCYGDEVYHFCDGSDTDAREIDIAIREAEALHVFVSAITSSFRHVDAELRIEDLRRWATDARMLIVGAYDSEAYVVWRPRG